jgi:hypothetical protein
LDAARSARSTCRPSSSRRHCQCRSSC